MDSIGKMFKPENLYTKMKEEPRCCNCSSISDLTATIPSSPFLNSGSSVEVRQALFFIAGCNKTSFEIHDFGDKLYLCSNCLTPVIDVYISKQEFLKRSSQKSCISKLTSPIVESILPDQEENTGESELQSLAIKNEYNFNAIDFIEIFASIKMKKLSENQENKIRDDFSTPERLHIISSKIFTNCKICHRKFLCPDLMNKHYNSVHEVNYPKYSCIFCPKKFALKWFIKHHVKIFHGGIEISHPCNICLKKFSNEVDLQNHKVKDHDIRKYGLKCNHCIESFEHSSQLRKHLVGSHAGTWEADAAENNIKEVTKGRQKECMICKKAFPNFTKCYQHMKSSHGSDKFPCLTCGLDFDSFRDLRRHQKCHNNLRCEECDKSFPTESKFRTHKRVVHESQRSCICEICGQSYTINQLSSHYSWHSQTSNLSKTYPCNMCNRSYRTKGLWSSHMNITHALNRKTYKCNDCNDKFPDKFALSKHLEEVHRKEFSFPCKICGRKFMDPRSLTVHSGVHTKAEGYVQQERISKLNKVNGVVNENKVDTMSCFSEEIQEFVCPVCGRTAGWKSHFIRHLRIHSLVGFTTPGSDKVLPATLKCSQCTQIFSRKDLLLRHIRKKHALKSPQFNGIKPCNLCGKEFTTKLQLDKHVNRHFIKIKTAEGENDLNFYFSEKNNLLECLLCSKEFSLQKQFLGHYRHFHKCEIIHDLDVQKNKNSELKRSFPCSYCSKQFWDKNLSKQHERVAHQERKIQCPTCNKLMKKHSLRFHINCPPGKMIKKPISVTNKFCNDHAKQKIKLENAPTEKKCDEPNKPRGRPRKSSD